jgi:hypothetical protein
VCVRGRPQQQKDIASVIKLAVKEQTDTCDQKMQLISDDNDVVPTEAKLARCWAHFRFDYRVADVRYNTVGRGIPIFSDI